MRMCLNAHGKKNSELKLTRSLNVMNPAFSGSLFKWDPRSAPPPAAAYSVRARALQELFEGYGVFRFYTAAKLAELGFTVNTLLNMRDAELDEMMDTLCHVFRWDLHVGERHGIKAAVRAQRRRLFSSTHALLRGRPQEGSDVRHIYSQRRYGSDEGPPQQAKKAARSIGGGGRGGLWGMVVADGKRVRVRKKCGDDDVEKEGGKDDEKGGGGSERQREHPFIVTVPGEVARGKKNGLDYLFHLYDQCRQFLIQFQKIAKERGEKYPTKVTNQVFRFAKKAGASAINKPKMRHYVHCYALHCLDEAASDALRRAFKEHSESVGAWREACYSHLVAVAGRQGWDIDAIFTAHPRLSIWYVPTKLRQLCHSHRINAAVGEAQHLLV